MTASPGKRTRTKRPSPDSSTTTASVELTAATQCRPHCGVCLDRCPEGVPIHDVLRHRMYFEGFGAEKEAMRLYAALETKADRCLGCSAPCAGACPYGIPIADRTREAHRLLTLS